MLIYLKGENCKCNLRYDYYTIDYIIRILCIPERKM